MELRVTAINRDDQNGSFQGIVLVPEKPPTLCSAVLKRNDGETLSMEASHTHSMDELSVCLDTRPDALCFDLKRASNPRFFRMVTNRAQNATTERPVHSKWRVYAQLTDEQLTNMIYILVCDNEGSTAKQLGKLFGAPISLTLRQLADFGRVRQKDRSPTGYWRYYPISPDHDA